LVKIDGVSNIPPINMEDIKGLYALIIEYFKVMKNVTREGLYVLSGLSTLIGE
jgi:hypothetical protein